MSIYALIVGRPREAVEVVLAALREAEGNFARACRSIGLSKSARHHAWRLLREQGKWGEVEKIRLAALAARAMPGEQPIDSRWWLKGFGSIPNTGIQISGERWRDARARRAIAREGARRGV